MDINKSSGYHPTSLPSRYGIGDLGKESYEFVDLLTQSKLVLAVLPLDYRRYRIFSILK